MFNRADTGNVDIHSNRPMIASLNRHNSNINIFHVANLKNHNDSWLINRIMVRQRNYARLEQLKRQESYEINITLV